MGGLGVGVQLVIGGYDAHPDGLGATRLGAKAEDRASQSGPKVSARPAVIA